MIKKITENNLIKKNDRIVMGISGGADSVFLAYILNELKVELNLDLIGVHINHGIRGAEAQRDENFVKDFLKKLNIPCETYHTDVLKLAEEISISSEEAGRQERYRIFNEVLEKHNFNKIAVAHNKDDNVETMLLNLFRGTGLNGLQGINIKRDNIIRPVLNISRKEIENFLISKNIPYVTDSTNLRQIYTRNKIRLDLLPYIKENINPNILNTLADTTTLIREENEFIENLADEKYKQTAKKEENKIIISMENVPLPLLKRIVRIALKDLNKSIKDISKKHIDSIISLKKGKKINLPYNIVCENSFDKIILSYKEEKSFNVFKIEIDKEYYLEDEEIYFHISHEKNNFSYFTTSLDCDKIKGEVTLRNRQKGDKIYIKSIQGHKKLKDIFIEKKIPAYKRDFIPVIACGDDVISAINVCTNDFYKKKDGTLYLQLWRK